MVGRATGRSRRPRSDTEATEATKEPSPAPTAAPDDSPGEAARGNRASCPSSGARGGTGGTA
eukprot:10703738-Lingulodinium_polyedra.AAC.1